VPSWSTGLLERASLRTDFAETAAYDATIKASVDLFLYMNCCSQTSSS
jgi:hypothetical protein